MSSSSFRDDDGGGPHFTRSLCSHDEEGGRRVALSGPQVSLKDEEEEQRWGRSLRSWSWIFCSTEKDLRSLMKWSNIVIWPISEDEEEHPRIHNTHSAWTHTFTHSDTVGFELCWVHFGVHQVVQLLCQYRLPRQNLTNCKTTKTSLKPAVSPCTLTTTTHTTSLVF